MDRQSYGIHWIHHTAESVKDAGQLLVKSRSPQPEDAIMGNGNVVDGDDEYGGVPTEVDIDQIAAENLIFMARDGQMVGEIMTAGTDENGTVVVGAGDGTPIDCESVMQQVAAVAAAAAVISPDDIVQSVDDAGGGGGGGGYVDEYADNTPQMVTEEVITDDWVQHQGEERVEIPAEQIIGSSSQVLLDIEVPLPTVQDEYTLLRPYPCDFCSRRFRKKASLMNHMVAHQNDRPHLCKLCSMRFFRRSDLINHLKAHADAPEPEYETDLMHFVEQEQHQLRHPNDHYYDQDWSMQANPVKMVKNSRKMQNGSGNSSSTSTSTTTTRGRISRLKPKEENYALSEPMAAPGDHSNGVMATDMVECQQLQAATAAVKLTQHHSPAHHKTYPVVDDSKPFVCQQCGLAFAREKALLSHAKNHRTDSPYECNQCNEMFWDAASLQEHQKSHQFEESNSEYDPGEAEAEETQSESESERLYGEFYCSECGMSFHREDLLRRHSKAHENAANDGELEHSKDRHCCNTCGETFAEALDLLAHAEIHARYPPFKCVLCGETFFEEHTIKRHLQSAHPNEMTPNSCILCGKECRDRKALIKHAWDHSREKCHSCSKCGKNFHNKARLKRHMASHRDKSVICDVCHEEFPDGRTLSNHRHSHSATASGKLFPCNECGKTFGSRSSQQIHVRIHTGERPYGCRFCWKAFADGGTLRKHERIHTGEKPYACSVCPRAFNQRVVLREHIRSHHSGVDAKRGTYYCSVCSMDLSSSGDLIQHLIQHSDMNTAMQRKPITGPRKYKRRRKLKPHEIARLRRESQQNTNPSENGSVIDISDFDMDNVDDFLGIADTSPIPNNVKPASKSKRHKLLAKHNGNNNNNNRNGVGNVSLLEEVDGHKKLRYNSNSSNSDKLWQSKLINSNTNDESYKSLLSNLENTLQSIDTLVVGSNGDTSGHVDEDRKPKYKLENADVCGGSAQRTQEVQLAKLEGKYQVGASNAKSRKKPEKSTNKAAARPRMIHTEKLRGHTSDGSRKRCRTFITCTESANIDLLPMSSVRTAASMVDDYDIISPQALPPKQISSSPLHIKQEHEQLQQQQHNLHLSSGQHVQSARNGDLYDAQLLLSASALRKESYEKFNASIVNDLEEILRSPLKCDRNERHRFTSESSTQFLVEQSEEEQRNMIKIEPTSPDLREIVVGGSAVGVSSGSSSSNERRPTRSSRNRLLTANRKYLGFETYVHPSVQPQRSTVNGGGSGGGSAAKSKATKSKKSTAPSKSCMRYTADAFNKSTRSSSPTANDSYAPLTAAGASMVTTAAVAMVQPEQRKQRYFECEMCSAVFADRAQLLDHVPIHI